MGVEIEDDGSFRRAPVEAQKAMLAAITQTSGAVAARMKARARVGPDAPHIKDDVDVRVAKKSAKVGFLSAKPAGGTDPNATQPQVAMWQQYGTDDASGDGFMSRSAEDEASGYASRMIRALKRAEQSLKI
jgi:hypothetical protein